MREEILDQLHVLRRHADDVAGAPAQEVGRRKPVELVVKRDPYLGEQAEGHVVGDPGFEPVQQAGEGGDRIERDQEPVHRGALFDACDDERAQHADTDEGHHARDAEPEGKVHAPAEGPYQAEQPHPGAPPAEAPRLQHLVVGFAWFGRRKMAVLGRGFRRRLRARRGGRWGGKPLPHLVGHQAVIDAAPCHQDLVAAALHDPALVQHEDAVGVDHAGEAMCHDEDRPSAHEAREGVLDHRLVLRIDRRERLVEQQDRRIPQERAGDGDALALAARKADAALADHRVVALRQAGDEAVSVGRPCGGFHFGVARVRLAEADVLRRRAVEQVRVLVDDAEARAERSAVERAQVLAAKQDAARLRVVEAHEQAQDRRLAGATRADDADPLACAHGEGETVVRGAPAARIGEMHVFEGDRRRKPGGVVRVVRVFDGGLGVEQAEQALRRRATVHAGVQERPQVAHGPEDLHPHHQHDEQHLDADGALGDAGRTHAERRCRANRDAGIGDAARGRVARQHPHRGCGRGRGLSRRGSARVLRSGRRP